MTDAPTARRQRGMPPSGATPARREPAEAVVRRSARPPAPTGRFEQLVVPPDTGGPRVRLGALWFFLVLAAVTGGRWWTAALTAVVAAAAGYQMARSWAIAAVAGGAADGNPDAGEVQVPVGTGRIPALIAAVLAAIVPLAAGYGTGAAGAALLVAAAAAALLFVVVDREMGATVAISAVLPAVAASSIVLALQVGLWPALFLVLTVSLYDAGNFLLGADAAGRWEGPVGGIMGALAVTFTIATVGVPPLDRVQWWLAGGVVAATCALGQWVTSSLLPTPTTWVPAMRRLDAYVVAGPLFVATAWLFVG